MESGNTSLLLNAPFVSLVCFFFCNYKIVTMCITRINGAHMLLQLNTILSRTKSKKKATQPSCPTWPAAIDKAARATTVQLVTLSGALSLRYWCVIMFLKVLFQYRVTLNSCGANVYVSIHTLTAMCKVSDSKRK